MHAVKQERHDEAEIQELAAKFMEANNKAKMAIPPPRPPQPILVGQGMTNMLRFLPDKSKQKNNSPVSASPTTTVKNSNECKTVDEESVRGRFGWTSVGKVHIPYIIRSGEHFCAVRMVEMKVLNKLLCYLHQDLYNCTNIRSYYITEAEARLLNDINFKHCDYQFGREQFTSRDLIVRKQDANEFYKFLGHCYDKLSPSAQQHQQQPSQLVDRCGFIRINRESVVPYTVYNGLKYVPLFYFEGETDNLKQKADKLEGWDLSYLKFCCKVQGIRNELFAHDSCSVISLNDIKNYFPPGTSFEDYWPKKNLDSQLLISNARNQAPVGIQWTRQPIAPPVPNHPPPSPKPATQAKAANNSPMHNVHVYSNYAMGGGQPPYHAPQPRTASSAVRATYPPSTRHMRPSTSYYGNLQPAPPPLVRASQTQASYTNSQSNAAAAAASNYLILEPSINQNNYHQASQLPKYPPPLLHMNGGIPARYDGPQTPRYGADPVELNSSVSRDLQNSYVVNSTQAQLINQQPAHQQSTARTQNSVVANDDRTMTNGRMLNTNTTVNRSKLLSIPDPPTSGNHIPYKIQKALVEGKLLPCINMKPYVYTDLLVTLPDLISNFFDNAPVLSCQQALQVLGIELYKPNDSQMRVLMENGKCQNANEIVPLVQVRNVINYMPQLKYLNGIVTPEIAAKRQRTS